MAGVLSNFAKEIIARQWLFSNAYSMLWKMPTINTFRYSTDTYNSNPELDIDPVQNYGIITDTTSIGNETYFSVLLKNSTNSEITVKQIALYNTISRYEMNEARGGANFRLDTSNGNLREWDSLYSYNQRYTHTADSYFGNIISAGPLNDLVTSSAYFMVNDNSLNKTSFAQASSKIYVMYDFQAPTKINEFMFYQNDNDWDILGTRLYGSTQSVPAWNSPTAWNLISTIGSFQLLKGKNKYVRFDCKNRYRTLKVEFDLPVLQTAFSIEKLDLYFSNLVAKIPVNIVLPAGSEIRDRVLLRIGD